MKNPKIQDKQLIQLFRAFLDALEESARSKKKK